MEPEEQQNQQVPPAPQATEPTSKPSYKKYFSIFGVIAVLLLIALGFLVIKINNKQPASPQIQNSSVNNQTNLPTQTSVTFAPQNLNQISGSPKNTTNLPLGDGKYVITGPKKGYIYLCRVMQGSGGAQETGSWISGSTWDLSKKPSVQGQISWPNAKFSSVVNGTNRVITGNDLPTNATTGIFPIKSTDPAYQYDRNPNTITTHNFTLTLPVSPSALSTPYCMGGEVGIMLNGVPLFNGFDAENRDAAAHEVQDSCSGHPQEAGEYHYHSLSSCIKDVSATTVIGFALDGFAITGPILPNGNYLTTNDLDECHGITSQISLDGKQVTTYHYVMTEDFPYSVGCFRGKPVQTQVISSTGQNSKQTGSQVDRQNSGHPQPPQEAISACSGKQSGTACSFTGPRGTINGTCQTPPGQTTEACVPANSGRQPPQ